MVFLLLYIRPDDRVRPNDRTVPTLNVACAARSNDSETQSNVFLVLKRQRYVCRLCINFQDLCAILLGVAALHILFLTFTSCFVIHFLSIRKVIIFCAIATDDSHPLRSRSVHQNAANCMTIRFHYIAQPRGGWKTYCARSRNDVRRLSSWSNGMPSKKK